MSRIGKKPISLPEKVKITKKDNKLLIEGPKGKLEHLLKQDFNYNIENNELKIEPKVDIEKNKKIKALYGLERALINNKVKGVVEGFKKVLLLQGVGYRAQQQGTTLNFTLGFSHPVQFKLPDGIQAKVEGQTKIILEGIDKYLVGQVAANIRNLKKPEPYKGKGIMYEGERIRRKAGKSAAGVKK